MLNESLFSLSFDSIKNVVTNDLTILKVVTIYVLVYVIYKALGRYIYFKPQEHSSKINRTFLVLSLIILSINFLDTFFSYLPFTQEGRWLYSLCSLVIIVAPLSILADKLIWKYDKNGHKYFRFNDRYIPLQSDYYKTFNRRQEGSSNTTNYWEEEGVESTRDNIHSDALINFLAMVVFVAIGTMWAYQSIASYGSLSLIFSFITLFWISAIFLDRAVFSWVKMLEAQYYIWRNKK